MKKKPVYEGVSQLQGHMTVSISQDSLREMASRWLPAHKVPRFFRIHQDTTQFFAVEYDDVVVLGENSYLIRHNARELRFGLEDEVKYWVKRAVDLQDGSQKILKLVFHEKFVATIGGLEFECFRSPKKEARVLNLVANKRNFMHGFSMEDEKGNLVRVLDLIKGIPLSMYVVNMVVDHETYFFQKFPQILDHFIECIRAIAFLHECGEKHGDIRRDHILIDSDSGNYRWIDFDFNYRHRENIYSYDLFGLGNVLAFLVGRGDLLLPDLKQQDHPALSILGEEDTNIVFNNRVVNLQKIYQYIPDSLNRVLLHFSRGANWFYENTAQLLEDLEEFRNAA
jgi:serine/threonine protein kinase